MTPTQAARNYIAEEELPPAAALAADPPAGGGMPVLDAVREQALVIGSEVVSFTIGVEADFRQAIADSSLFAQLVALKKVGAEGDPMAFFDAYFDALLGLGWIVQDRDKAEYDQKTDGFDVHSAVIEVVKGFLAPIAGAADVVIKVLTGLRAMDADKPFIKLFDKQSRRGKVGRFQFTYVSNDPQKGLQAKIMAFALNAKETLTQVLFLKLHKQRTKMRRSLGTLSADTALLAEIRPNLAAKVKAYRTAFIAEADLGPVPEEA